MARSEGHTFSKPTCAEIHLIAGVGVDGDAHAGAMVQHASRDGLEPNLRQVHLIQVDLLEELDLTPGAIGENITVQGIDLLALSEGTLLRLGDTAVVRLTGLRTPCLQINRYREGLMRRVAGKAADGSTILRSGVMGVVVSSGAVRPGDLISTTSPAEFRPMQQV